MAFAFSLHRGVGDLCELPHVWRAQEMAHASVAALPTGFAALDAQLPGGGWPAAGLVELLQAQGGAKGLGPGGQHDFQVLLPALAALLGQHKGPLVLVGAPWVCGASLALPQGGRGQLMPFTPALAAQGLPPERLLQVQAATPAALLWACEQALRCADVPAVLAWLPRAQPEALRRLHVGAMEHGKPLWVLRPQAARQASSAAPLRLLLGNALVDGVDMLQVQVLKRRGPPLEQALHLSTHSERLAALLATRRGSTGVKSAVAIPPTQGLAQRPTQRLVQIKEGAHALARLVPA